MKKLVFLFGLCAVLLCVACKQPTSSNYNETDTESVTPGWYLYTTNADSSQPQLTYLYINSNGTIERAGSSSYEYTGSTLEMMQNQLSYSICKKNADGTDITFAACEAPSWGTVNTDCPYTEGEYLDVTKHSTFSWPVNKNLQLWSAKENNYYCSCSDSFGYINAGNTFVVGSSLSAGACITITMEDTDYNTYTCDVYFSAAVDNTNNQDDTDNTTGEGYEWYCFENAYTGNLDGFVLYDIDGNPIRAGSSEAEETNSLFLAMTKEQAISNFNGTVYKVTTHSQLPSWCLK